MARKRLARLTLKHAWSIVAQGTRARHGDRNPYRQGTTQWYCWKTGKDNPSYSAIELTKKLEALGFPIGD